MKKPKTTSKPGRPPEGRKRFVVHILPLAITRICYLVSKKANTPGKVIEAAFGVTTAVAGARGRSAGSARAGKQVKPRQHPNVLISHREQ